MINLVIDNIEVNVPTGTTILEAARSAGVYIPVLCSHPGLPLFHSLELSDFVYQGTQKITNDPGETIDSLKGCKICIVEMEGLNKPIPACKAKVEEGIIINTNPEHILKTRRENLVKILATQIGRASCRERV